MAIAPGLNLAVVANRDGRSLSVIDLRTPAVTATIPLPDRPERVAASGSLAAAVSPWSQNLYLLDLSEQKFPVTPISLGHASRDVALDSATRLAVVLDKHRRRISVIDFRASTSHPLVRMPGLPEPADHLALLQAGGRTLALATSQKQGGLLFEIDVSNPSDPGPVRTLPLSGTLGPKGHDGVAPVGIAVNAATNQAIIADQDGTLLVYDLRSLSLRTMEVAHGPLQDVAVDPPLNLAITPGQNDDALVVDLASGLPVFHVSVGRKPVSVAVNGDPSTTTASRVAVVNQDEDSVSVFDLPSAPPPPGAPPHITSLSPTSVVAGSAGFTLTTAGSGFASTAVVQFGSTSITPKFIDASQLQAKIPSTLLTAAGTILVTVTVKGQTSNAAQFTILPPPNPVPVINPPLFPNNVISRVVTTFLPLTINGDQFVGSSQVRFNGVLVSSITQSATQITADIPGTLLINDGTEPLTVSVTVTNLPSGGDVASAPFIIKPAGDPAGVTTATIDVGAPTSGVAVDAAHGMAVVTRFGTTTGAIGNTAVRLENLRGIIPGNPPVALDLPDGLRVGYSPVQAAINPNNDTAVITNLFADPSGFSATGTVSILDMQAGVQRARISLAARPEGVAVDPSPVIAAAYPKGIATVGSRLDGTLTLINLATNTPIGSPISIGAPTGIAINPTTHLAAVADESTSPGRVFLIDLADPTRPRTLAQVRVGNSPARIAIDPARNLAVVSNQDDNTVSVIDLTARRESARLTVGQQPFGVAIDEGLGVAAIINRLDATLSLVSLKTVPPTVLFLGVNLPFVPTEVAIVPGVFGVIRLLTTDVGSQYVGVIDIDTSVLP